MTMKRVGGVFFFVLAAVFAVSGAVTLSQGVGVGDPSGLGVSRLVGTFLPTLLCLIVGLWLFRTPQTKEVGPGGRSPGAGP